MTIVDPITLEVIRNSLIQGASEMKTVVMRTAYSTLWRESGDLSCGILTVGGDVVAQGPEDIPVHLATMPFSLKGALSKIPLENILPGDVLFHNDPRWGNNHLPDCLMAKPIFVDGKVVAFTAVRGHWTDIGGSGPGSYTTVTRELIQEGLCIPPVKLYKAGVLDQELVDFIMANVRGTDQRMADLRSQYAGCIVGERKVLELAHRYGTEVLIQCMADVLDYSERMTRREIEKIPDGVYHAVDYCDGDGVTDQPIRIEVTVSIKGSDVVVDYTGSSPQVIGGMNAPIAVSASAAQYAFKALTDPWNPANSGSYRPISIIAPEGSVANPRPGAPVVAANHETGNVMVDAIFAAVAEAASERVIAPACASAGVVVFGGEDQRPGRNGKSFIYNEPHGASWGARLVNDGINGMRCGLGNTGNHSIEVVETEYPVRVTAYELVPDAGGPGRTRGGLPLRRVYEILSDCLVTITAERSRIAAPGLLDGSPGGLARFVLNPGTAREEVLFSKTRPFSVSKGDRLLVQAAGGGGIGSAAERPALKVAEDLENGYITATHARSAYGYKT